MREFEFCYIVRIRQVAETRDEAQEGVDEAINLSSDKYGLTFDEIPFEVTEMEPEE